MTEAETMQRDIDQCGRLCTTCHGCNQHPVAAYEPGGMWLTCICRTVSVHDWDVRALRNLWEIANTKTK